MKVISLFSGAGISDVGFHQAGLECLAQVEIDKTASSVRKRHFPDTEHHEDIHEFNAIRFRGACDVVAGGFPCQDYSVAGNRAGLLGDRGALWWQFLRVIDEAKPDLVFGENVPGLLSSDGGAAFRSIIMSLVELGYSVAWRVLDLRYFGVPQRRRRVFIVGTRVASSSGGRAGSRIFEPDCLPWNSEKGREEGEGSAWIAGTLSANGGGRPASSTGHETSFLVPWTVGTLAANAGGLTRPAGNANEPDFCIPEIAQCLLAKGNDPQDPSLATYLPVTAFTCSEQANSYAWERPHYPTITAQQPSDSSNIQHGIRQGARVRRILPIEAERLMGLPDNFTEFGADGEKISNSARYKMLGNGWSVPQARWLAEKFTK